MKKIKIFRVVLLALLPLACAKKEYTKTFTATVDDENFAVTVPVAELSKEFEALEVERWLPYDETGAVIPFQYNDTNTDGTADELYFQLNAKANQPQTVIFKLSEATFSFPVYTNVHLGKKEGDGQITSLSKADRLKTWDNTITQKEFQAEGVCWENDKVGFRNYLDMRNGMDIFGKTTEEMVMDKVGTPDLPSYHELADWGMDVLKVGQSLGAGSMALMYKDSLIRLTSDNASFKILYEGPLKSAFQFDYKGIDLGDQQIDAVNTITIEKGDYYYTSTIQLSDEEGIEVVAGIVNKHKATVGEKESNGFKILWTYGQQSENKDVLGMAIGVPQENFIKAINTNTISETIPNTEAVFMKPERATYRFYASWLPSEPSLFESEPTFTNFLKMER